MSKIPVAGPWITQKEIDYVTDAVTNCWYANHAMYHVRFEEAFAAYVGRKFAISLPSCTSGLHLSLAALDIGPGDEVIVPDTTWIATAAPISYVGATPVFADVDAASWCLTPEAFEATITPKTKAVILVDLYGNMPDMDGILSVAEKHGVAVIEDAAEAIGSQYNSKMAGSFGLASTFSFHGSKTLTTGEGGMLVTDDQAFYERCMFLRDHGRTPGDRHFKNTEVAFKYKMSSMQAALGLAQLERMDELVTRKRDIFRWYQSGLEGIKGITLNSEAPGVKNTYWMITILLNAAIGMEKEQLMAELWDNGFDSRPFFHPLSSLPAYQDQPEATRAVERNKTAYDISPRGINLPSALNLTEENVQAVCEAVQRLLSDSHRSELGVV